jgi:hypothetical protein
MGSRVVIAGSLAGKPGRGGHAWVLLQYLLGFRRLGCDVLFLDRLDGEPARARHVRDLMRRFGLEYALVAPGEAVGLSRAQMLERVRGSEFLLNVMGFLDDEEVLAAARRRVFLDIDPGFGQMWRELGLADVFAGHDVHVTIGENVGRETCTIPTCGIAWVTTRQPVVLSQWPVQTGAGGRFTSVCSWRGAYDPVELDGRRYGLRVHEFRKFAELPRQTDEAFELALDIHPAETPDLELLDRTGWSLADPAAVAGDPWSYRAYVQASKAELMVAKGMYVETRSGWFSDRSICYLASGRPVVAQDTALAGLLPVGEGLLTFTTLGEAREAVRSVGAEYPRHAGAARALAEEYFDSDRVLARLADLATAA